MYKEEHLDSALRPKLRWIRSVAIGLAMGMCLYAAAHYAITREAPLASAREWLGATLVKMRWSTVGPEKVSGLRDKALEVALLEGDKWLHIKLGDHKLPIVIERTYPESPISIPGVEFEVLTDREVQSRADKDGTYWAFYIGSPRYEWHSVTVYVGYHQHFAKGRASFDLGSRGATLECRLATEWHCTVSNRYIA